MAKTFTFWYSETVTYKGWFEAESIEQARELLEQVMSADIDMEADLPKFGFKDKGFELEIDLGTIEEIEESI